MKIKCAPNHILVKADYPKAGTLVTDSRPSAIEKAKVIEVAEDIKWIKKGDTVHFKSWSVDIIQDGEEKYYYIDLETRGVKAVIG